MPEIVEKSNEAKIGTLKLPKVLISDKGTNLSTQDTSINKASVSRSKKEATKRVINIFLNNFVFLSISLENIELEKQIKTKTKSCLGPCTTDVDI